MYNPFVRYWADRLIILCLIAGIAPLLLLASSVGYVGYTGGEFYWEEVGGDAVELAFFLWLGIGIWLIRWVMTGVWRIKLK